MDQQQPRHWIGIEELETSYWNDPAVVEKRGQEFHDKPVETIEMIERMDTSGIARRDFLTVMGASMAMASFACARRPVNKIIPYVVQPEEITPGVATYYASTDPETGYGVLIKTREGRPIKLEGNPDHPINQGKLNAKVQAMVLSLYDPERIKGAFARDRATGATRPVNWTEADTAIQSKLKPGARVRVLTKPVVSESARRLIREFLAGFGDNGKHVEWDAAGLDEVYEGQALSYGAAVMPHYRFEDADVVVSIGADFLGSFPGSVGYAADWSKGRKLRAANASHQSMSKLVTFESVMSLTGANSDERAAIRPGDELKVALAIAHALIVTGKRSRYASDASVAGALAGYSPAKVAEELGLEEGAAKFAKAADLLWANRGKGIVIAGSVQSKSKDAVALQVAVNLLNSACENEGSTVDGTALVSSFGASFAGGYGPVEKLIAEMKAGAVDVLVIHRANPVFTLPESSGIREALKKVPMVIAINEQDDETTAVADFVLGDHHWLENWGDARPYKDLYSLQQPAISPMYETRSFEDSLLSWVKGGAHTNAGLAGRVALSAAGQNTWHHYVMLNWKESIYKEYGMAASFDQFWEGSLREGVFNGYAARGNSNPKGSARGFKTDSLSRLPKYSEASKVVKLALYSSGSMGDGTHANNAWLQEMPDSISTLTWDNALNVGPTLAKKLSVKTHDVVEVKMGDVKIELPVLVQPGMHPESVSAAFGYGREVVGKVGKGSGTNVYPFAKLEGGRYLASGSDVELRKTGKVFRLAETQWHHASENRPIINDITLTQFKQNPATANHTDPHLRMDEVPSIWPKHEYKNNRWAMAVDLSSCTGCGACIVGCQAENNIPVVGRDNVRVSREMHWIRIDRYYSGSAENPDVVFQPMMCQHCENAPCETVCPVLATVHGEDGLNQQVYNRCVGTRYCQNNCPYKVRRFNFFDHWKQYTGSSNMVWNPDVTVRTRGIMEKCTFCVQRIQEGRNTSKLQGTKIFDGMVKTACQQTCPTDAIVFGDLNDSESQVSKLAKEKHAFRVLEVLNTRPSVHYLSKVRNKENTHSDHHAGA